MIIQRGGPEIAACAGMRFPWDRDVLWAQNSGTGRSYLTGAGSWVRGMYRRPG